MLLHLKSFIIVAIKKGYTCLGLHHSLLHACVPLYYCFLPKGHYQLLKVPSHAVSCSFTCNVSEKLIAL